MERRCARIARAMRGMWMNRGFALRRSLRLLIKLHGFRIELEDVEENIRALRGVKQACVVPVVHKESIAYLKAFIVLQKHPDGTPAYEASSPMRRIALVVATTGRERSKFPQSSI